VFTDGSTTDQGFDSVRPVDDWRDVAGMQTRRFDPQMFANLPDVSYSVADWVMGNERCPLDYTDVVTDNEQCYAFKGWMGALNSTHFPPQSFHSWRGVPRHRARQRRSLRRARPGHRGARL